MASPKDTSLAADRPTTLDGIALGVLDNNKHGSERFLRKVVELIQDRFQLSDVVWAQKPEPTRPADATLLEDFIPRADVFVTAIGD